MAAKMYAEARVLLVVHVCRPGSPLSSCAISDEKELARWVPEWHGRVALMNMIYCVHAMSYIVFDDVCVLSARRMLARRGLLVDCARSAGVAWRAHGSKTTGGYAGIFSFSA